MTIHGVVNAWVDGRGIDPPVQTSFSPMFGIWDGTVIFQLSTTFFVTLYRFLNSVQAQDVGVVRRAYYKGADTSPTGQYSAGLGMDYWDESSPVGNQAFAVFEFTQASPKFWVLIQEGSAQTVISNNGNGNFQDGVAFGLGNANPAKLLLPWTPGTFHTGQISEFTLHSGVGIAIATELSGNSPWNGTTGNSGSDSKGVPIWTTSSLVWPRSNNVQGVSSSWKYHMFGLYYDMACLKHPDSAMGSPQIQIESFFTHNETRYDQHDTVYHMIIDKDQIVVLVDSMNINNHTFFYFGKYTPYMSSSVPSYVSVYKNLMFNDDADALTVNSNQVYGSRDIGWNSVHTEDQPLNDLTLHHGGVLDPATGNVIGASLYCNPMISSSNPFYNTSINSIKPNPVNIIQLHNPIVCANEYPGRRAPLGEITFFKLTNSLRAGVTLASRSLASFGIPKLNSHKIIVPWHSASHPGLAMTRSGTIF